MTRRIPPYFLLIPLAATLVAGSCGSPPPPPAGASISETCGGATGPMDVRREVAPGSETCDESGIAAVDALYFEPPAHLVGGSDARLIPELAIAARQARDSDYGMLEVLAASAVQHFVVDSGGAVTPPDGFAMAERQDVAQAFADLPVVGRSAFARFQRLNPQVADLAGRVGTRIIALGLRPDPADVEAAVRRTLDRAYTVVEVLRDASSWSSRDGRPALGWIAVSGEDDPPHRPTNVPSAGNLPAGPYPQYDLRVQVGEHFVDTRWISASLTSCDAGSGEIDLPFHVPSDDEGGPYLDDPFHDPLFDEGEPPAEDEELLEILFPLLPPDESWLATLAELGIFDVANELEYPMPHERVPCIPAEDDIVIFVHGHSSRLEEAMDLVPEIHDQSWRRRRDGVTVIAMDLPNNGYASMINHQTVAPTGDSEWHLHPAMTGIGRSTYPILDFNEDFLVAFVETLDARFDIADRIVAVVGGSLGGNMGLRLGQRSHAWAHTVVAWSPASVFGESWGGATADLFLAAQPYYYHDSNKDIARTFAHNELDEWQEYSHLREDYFHNVFRRPSLSNQSERWYRGDDWQACKDAYIGHAVLERREIYNRWYRLWHWRVAYEQLLYSHYDQLSRSDDTRRFETITSRTLLLAGEKDNASPDKLHDRAAEMAERMVNTPGCGLFLRETGHSIHAERPRFLATEIVGFLPRP